MVVDAVMLESVPSIRIPCGYGQNFPSSGFFAADWGFGRTGKRNCPSREISTELFSPHRAGRTKSRLSMASAK
jgi:hypothetical protein